MNSPSVRLHLAKSPIVAWRFGELSGATAHDTSGNGRHLACSTVTWGQSGALVAVGNYGAAGVVGTASAGTHWNFGAGDFAIVAWMKTSQSDTRVFAGESSEAPAWWVGMVGTAAGRPAISIGGTTVTTAAKTINDGVKHKVMFRRKAGVADFAVDRTIYAGGSLAGAAGTSTSPVEFGNFADAFAWADFVDEVYVYTGANVPTDVEYQAMYDADTGINSILVNNAAIHWNEPVVVVNGSSYARSVNASSLCKFDVSGTSLTGSFSHALPLAAGKPSGQYPKICWRWNGGAWSEQQLSAATPDVVFGTGMTAGPKSFEWGVSANDDYGDLFTASPVDSVTCLGFWDETLSPVVSATILKPRQAWIFADSIPKGDWVLGAIGGQPEQIVTKSDATLGWFSLLCDDADVECVNISFGGQNFDTGNWKQVPKLTAAWSLKWTGQSRLTGGVFTTQPDDLYVAVGTNPNGVAAAAMTTFIGTLRTAAPAARIFICCPFDGDVGAVAGITTGVADYLAANPAETKVFKIDLGHAGATYSTTIPDYSYDGIHPNTAGHALFKSLMWAAAASPHVELGPGITTVNPIISCISGIMTVGGTAAQPATFRVQSVMVDLVFNVAAWVFQKDVTLTGSNVPELLVDGQAPISVSQNATRSLLAVYSFLPIVGMPWAINSAPSNIAESANIIVPENSQTIYQFSE